MTPWQKDEKTASTQKKCSCEVLNNVQSHFLVNNIYIFITLITYNVMLLSGTFRKGFWLMREVHVI
jgi:hypothetical protein